MEYIELRKIPSLLGLKKGDVVQISSDITDLWKVTKKNEGKFDLNAFIDEILAIIGPEGTLLIPTFNWDFCKGKCFDYKKTPSQTGFLGSIALRRKDFKRTHHALYSFAVAGKDADLLFSIDNKDSFGPDSPFAYLERVDAVNITIGIPTGKSFTLVHYIEEKVGIPYRYIKDFTAEYIDENGVKTTRTYSMNVRDLDMDVVMLHEAHDQLLEERQAIEKKDINGVRFEIGRLSKMLPPFEEDVKYNHSLHICNYKGQ